MGKALDTGMSEVDKSNQQLDTQYLGMTGQNEQMRLQADEFNAEGEFSAEKVNSDKWSGLAGQTLTAGMGMMGQQLGMDAYKKNFGGIDVGGQYCNSIDI